MVELIVGAIYDGLLYRMIAVIVVVRVRVRVRFVEA